MTQKESELYLNRKGGLISQGEWVKAIKGIKGNTNRSGIIRDEEKASELLKEELTNAVIKRAEENNSVLFSGGIDSTIIAFILQREKIRFKCYTVGLKHSADLDYAKKVADEYNFKIRIRIIEQREIEEELKKIISILRTSNKTQVSIGTVSYFGLEAVKKDRMKSAFTGLGSEDIFAGYNRYLKGFEQGKDINEECWNGLTTTYIRDFVREKHMSDYFNIKEKTPFLDKNIIKTGMRITQELKIKKGLKKYILRKAAEKLGIKKEFSIRPKKAAQYGSGVEKAIIKLAKSSGYNNEKDYLEGLSNYSEKLSNKPLKQKYL